MLVMTRPTVRERLDFKLRATVLGIYPNCLAASRTFLAVISVTALLSEYTLDTVATGNAGQFCNISTGYQIYTTLVKLS